MTALPQTIATDIQQPLEALIDQGRFVSRDAAEVVNLLDQIDQLAQADRDEALKWKALVLHITGDMDGALDVLMQRSVYDPITHFVILTNYSRCKDAQRIFKKYGAPRESLFSYFAQFAFAIGAFGLAAQFVHEASKMRLTNLETVPLEKIMAANDLLSHFGVTDNQAAEVLEVAGDVLRSHGLMFEGPGPVVDVLDVPGEIRAVHLTYEISAAPSVAASIAFDFIEQIEFRNVSIPSALHISFAGTQL